MEPKQQKSPPPPVCTVIDVHTLPERHAPYRYLLVVWNKHICRVLQGWFVPEPFRRAGISSPGALLLLLVRAGWSDSPGELRGMDTALDF